MKMNEEHLEHLRLYLETKKVHYLDIKSEVLDHMACSIRDTMQKKNISFIDAFELERKKWDIELQGTYSFWLGAKNTYPKIVSSKMVELTKKLFLKTIIMSFILLIFAYFFRNFLEINSAKANTVVGCTYLIFGLGIVFMYLQMISSKTNTTFKQLYKIHIIPHYITWCLLFNPLNKVFALYETYNFGVVFMHLFLMSLLVNSVFVYREHNAFLKTRMV